MSAAQLEQMFTANKPAILGAGAAVVVGLGLYKRHQTAKAPAAGDPAAAGTSGLALPYSAGGQTSMTGATYDSSASDLYGAIQPQMESIGGQLSGLLDKLNNPTPVPVPAPVAAPAPAPAPVWQPPAPVWQPPPPPPQPAPAAPRYAVDTWYTVKKGDTLSGIAARFPQQSITAQSIGAANGVANINRINPGQVFHIFGN